MQGNIGNSAQMMSHDIHIHRKTVKLPPIEWTINDGNIMIHRTCSWKAKHSQLYSKTLLIKLYTQPPWRVANMNSKWITAAQAVQFSSMLFHLFKISTLYSMEKHAWSSNHNESLLPTRNNYNKLANVSRGEELWGKWYFLYIIWFLNCNTYFLKRPK